MGHNNKMHCHRKYNALLFFLIFNFINRFWCVFANPKLYIHITFHTHVLIKFQISIYIWKDDDKIRQLIHLILRCISRFNVEYNKYIYIILEYIYTQVMNLLGMLKFDGLRKKGEDMMVVRSIKNNVVCAFELKKRTKENLMSFLVVIFSKTNNE